MLSLDNLQSNLESYVNSNWLNEEDPPTLRANVEWPNEVIDPTNLSAWVRVAILPATAMRDLITGNPETGQETTGLFVFQVFTPANTGAGVSNILVDSLIRIFNEKYIATGVFTGVPLPQVIGNANGWYQVNINIPFEVNI